MKQKIIASMVVIVICLMVGGIGADDEPEKRVMNYIAVMDLKCGEGVKKSLSPLLTDMVIEELVRIKKYKVIDRANRDKMMLEVGIQQSGCVDDNCTIEFGRQAGVGKIVVGSVDKLGDMYLVRLQLLNVESAEVEVAESHKCMKCDEASLVDAVMNASKKLMGVKVTETQPKPEPVPIPMEPEKKLTPKPEEIKFIPATPEQQASCSPDMVYVPAGWFMMGCNRAKDARCEADEYPYHAVYLDAFCIDKYEFPNKKGEKPKITVNWPKAYSLCTSQGKRLPTETEWEKAARGTDGRTYPWGEGIDSSKAMYGKRFGSRVASGSYESGKSPYGTYDMAGNLYEWTQDWYDTNYYKNSPSKNPRVPSTGSSRVLRGCGFWPGRGSVRASDRFYYRPGGRGSDFGFRCAKDAP